MGRLYFVLGVFFCVVFALVPTPGFSQLSNNALSLSGTVFDDSGDRRVPAATVELYDPQGNRLLEAVTNHAGEFSFSGLRAARYLLRARAEGFVETEMPVDLSLASAHGVSLALKSAAQTASALPEVPSISAHELSMPESARDLLSSGINKLYKENNAQAGMYDFQAAIAKAPGFYEAYYQAGMAYLTLQNQAEAEAQFRKSVELSQSRFAEADIALGTLLLQRQQQAEGETFLRQGLALHPHSWPGQVELGKLELSRGHLESALAAAQKAQSLAPQQPMVYRLLALIHMQGKNYSLLASDLDNYIRLDPDSAAGLRAKELRAQLEKQIPQSASASAGHK